MRDVSELLDLDIWTAERPDGRIYAYTNAAPHFQAVSSDMEELIAEVRWTLRTYAQTHGHELRFGLIASPRPAGMPVPDSALPVPVEGAARVTGRLVVSAVRDGSGKDPYGQALAGFLARSRAAAPRQPAQGRARPRPR